MGQQDQEKLEVQKESLRKVFVDLITTNISIMNFQLSIQTDKTKRRKLQMSVRQSEKALDVIKNIKHAELLQDLYVDFIRGGEPFFMNVPSFVVAENKLQHFDTDDGFEEYMEIKKQVFKNLTTNWYNRFV